MEDAACSARRTLRDRDFTIPCSGQNAPRALRAMDREGHGRKLEGERFGLVKSFDGATIS